MPKQNAEIDAERHFESACGELHNPCWKINNSHQMLPFCVKIAINREKKALIFVVYNLLVRQKNKESIFKFQTEFEKHSTISRNKEGKK